MGMSNKVLKHDVKEDKSLQIKSQSNKLVIILKGLCCANCASKIEKVVL